MRAIFSNPVYRFIWIVENKIWKKKSAWEKHFFRLLAKNQHQNFDLKQKRCAIRRINVLNFCYFWKRAIFDGEKRIKEIKLIPFINFSFEILPSKLVFSLTVDYGEKFFSSKLYFLSSIWIYKLLFNRIPLILRKKVVHCYSLCMNKGKQRYNIYIILSYK